MSLLFCENDSLNSNLLSFELPKSRRQKFVSSQSSALIGQLWHQPADDSKLTNKKYFYVAKKAQKAHVSSGYWRVIQLFAFGFQLIFVCIYLCT